MLNAFKSPQTVVLIGAGSEIGQQVVRQLSRDNLNKLILVSREGSGTGDEIGIPIKSEYKTQDQRNLLVQKIFSYVDVDLVVISIGLLKGKVEEIMLINYVASVDLLSQIAQRMKIQGHGQIVVLSTFAQTRPRLENYEYGSAKAGLDFYARGLSRQLEKFGVKIQIIRLGFVFTKMTSGLEPAPFSISAAQAGREIKKILQGKRRVSYVPRILILVSIVVRTLPERLFAQLEKSDQ
jgi:decaprenylphospho-beta-D-erythro-pentofuranosid-2-ulose 2-reductase